ncbi:Receptor-like kinase [Quillaja saponaria]|uniref:Receptor-like kinase n=1 Tax=Quillaja saponaria TaxID=32244 RepID=A0AAD7P7N2_QUISA|nr:Receptor-like kinase [Quillaja saponaria]
MAYVQFLVFLFLIFLAFPSPRPVCGNAELSALMELKTSLDPENNFLSSWTTDGDPCSGSFVGVACNEHRKVANISLQGKGLSGWVSPAVAGLKCLSGLYLHYNNLSGKIPREISNLNELTDLYLDVNNLTGSIPPEIGNMASLQVLQICCNQLTGNIPTETGSLKSLSVLALQYNRLTGQIPSTLGNLGMLRRLDLSFNNFIGTIPARLADIAQLEALDVRNNSLTGIVPTALKRLKEGFQSANNPGLCGVGFLAMRACTAFDNVNVNQLGPPKPSINNNTATEYPESANIQLPCNQTHCAKSRKIPQVAVIAAVITITITLMSVGLITFLRYRRQKQKITSTSDCPDDRLSTDQAKDFYRRSPSPLVSLEYSNGWGPLADGHNSTGLSSHEQLNYFRFNMDEIESATQYFSETSLLGKSNFSAVYKGILRDGSLVAIRSINMTCCKSEDAEFVKGLNLLTSLRHENLVRLRGFCCSSSRGECFLIYDFAPKGDLSHYIDVDDGCSHILDWSKRVSIINGIAKGIGYLHTSDADKPTIVHQNISIEKILIDQQFNPLISDSGLPKLLADDIVFSTLKVSAAMGYLAPEYVTTGRFTEKSDIYAFGVIVLQVLSGKRTLGGSMRLAVESFRLEDLVDKNLNGKYSKAEAAMLGRIALLCTQELPNQRPTMQEVIQELGNSSDA